MPDKLDTLGESLISQGMDPLQVKRAVGLVRRMIGNGALPEYRYLLNPSNMPDPAGSRPLELLQIVPHPPGEQTGDS